MYKVVAYDVTVGSCMSWIFETRKEAVKCCNAMNSYEGCGAYIEEV